MALNSDVCNDDVIYVYIFSQVSLKVKLEHFLPANYVPLIDLKSSLSYLYNNIKFLEDESEASTSLPGFWLPEKYEGEQPEAILVSPATF